MTDEELRRLFDELQQGSAAAHSETRQQLDARLAAVDGRFDELRRHFDITAEALQGRIDHLAEAVTTVAEQLVRTENVLDQRIERTAAETQAMIKFSHAELSRRVDSLEDGQRELRTTVSDLQARVERLEQSTH